MRSPWFPAECGVIETNSKKSEVVDGVEVFPIPGWEGRYSISTCGKVWSHHFGKWKKPSLNKRGYHQVMLSKNNRSVPKQLHRVMAAVFFRHIPEGAHVDHIDRNKTNNRLSNLRITTPQENAWNSKLSSANSSGFKGVSKIKGGKWLARIYRNGQPICLGSFADPEEAGRAYDKAAREYGSTTALNFPISPSQ